MNYTCLVTHIAEAEKRIDVIVVTDLLTLNSYHLLDVKVLEMSNL